MAKGRVRLTGCKSGAGTLCTAKSSGAAEGEIVTASVKAQLGTVKPGEAASGVGLLLTPEAGSIFFTLATNACSPETVFNGSVAGEVSPIGKLQSTGKLIYGVTSGAQNIKSITVAGITKSPELEAFGAAYTFASSNDLTYAGAVEII